MVEERRKGALLSSSVAAMTIKSMDRSPASEGDSGWDQAQAGDTSEREGQCW
jgi:hypothetical protein